MEIHFQKISKYLPSYFHSLHSIISSFAPELIIELHALSLVKQYHLKLEQQVGLFRETGKYLTSLLLHSKLPEKKRDVFFYHLACC